ncbi:hypothetical protein EV361DRAFT_954993 [Lentinula raphanica]|nr:hypothetical protein EV361DRAFT_954993 [Lentinula raphanica]
MAARQGRRGGASDWTNVEGNGKKDRYPERLSPPPPPLSQPSGPTSSYGAYRGDDMERINPPARPNQAHASQFIGVSESSCSRMNDLCLQVIVFTTEQLVSPSHRIHERTIHVFESSWP